MSITHLVWLGRQIKAVSYVGLDMVGRRKKWKQNFGRENSR